jgi:hypothetical protein
MPVGRNDLKPVVAVSLPSRGEKAPNSRLGVFHFRANSPTPTRLFRTIVTHSIAYDADRRPKPAPIHTRPPAPNMCRLPARVDANSSGSGRSTGLVWKGRTSTSGTCSSSCSRPQDRWWVVNNRSECGCRVRHTEKRLTRNVLKCDGLARHQAMIVRQDDDNCLLHDDPVVII